MTDQCPCGKPLHYTDPRIWKYMKDLVKVLGVDVTVVHSGRYYMVSRHYIALHGLKPEHLPHVGRLLK